MVTNDIVELCEGETFMFAGQVLDSAGIYADTLQSTAGCDSISNIELVFNPVFFDTTYAEICDGDMFNFEGQSFGQAGYHNVILQSQAGCDSTITIDLNVLPLIEEEIEAQICIGSYFVFVEDTLSVSGTYTKTLTSADGCDSTVTLNLQVLEQIVTNVDKQICEGSEYIFNDSTYTMSTQQTFNFVSVQGCDSIVNFDLQVLSEITEEFSVEICEGESYEFGDTTITTSGTFQDQYISRDGCDSISILTVVVLESKTSEVDISICEGSTHTLGDQTFNESGSYEVKFLTSNGCDSTVTLNLSVVGSIQESINVTICTGDTYDFNGESLSTSGTYTSSHTSVNGCDSTVTLNLTVVDGFSNEFVYTICEGETVVINGIEYEEAISFEETFTSSSGCDSVVAYTITVLPGIELSAQDYQICVGDEIEISVTGGRRPSDSMDTNHWTILLGL